MDIAESSSPVLKDWNDGFLDGYRGKARQKNRGSQYLSAYRRGQVIRTRSDNGGDDTGMAPRGPRGRGSRG